MIAAWTGRPDLTGSHRSNSPVIENATMKADIAIEQIRNGTKKGWRNLTEAVNDLIFHNQMSVTRRIITQAVNVAVAMHGEGHATTKDIRMLEELWDARTASLDWDNASTWQPGSPASTGYFLILSDGPPRLSHVSDREHPDIGNEAIQHHLRIQSPPKGHIKKDRTTIDHQELPGQLQLFPQKQEYSWVPGQIPIVLPHPEGQSPDQSTGTHLPSPLSTHAENSSDPNP